MNSLATIWTDLQRSLASGPQDWPIYICPVGHEMAIPPFSRLWDKETRRLTDRPVCYDCEKAKRSVLPSRPRHFPDRETALRAHGVPASFARQRFVGGLPHVLGHDLATWRGGPDSWAVVLHGLGNAGKSMLAAEILWQRLPHVHTTGWWRASQLVDALFGSLGEEAKAGAHRDCVADLLVIDDLGHIVGERGFDCLYNVIVARQEEERASIFTFNEPLVAFCKQHWAIGSRLTRGTILVPFVQTYAQRISGPPADPAWSSLQG